MRLHRPCPECGGRDRFYLVRNPRNGGLPFWNCRRCGYREYVDGEGARLVAPVTHLTDDDARFLQRVMAEAAECLRSNASAQRYLERRGIDLRTQDRLAGMLVLGFLPSGWISAWIRREKQERLLRGESPQETVVEQVRFERLGFGVAAQAPSIVFGYQWEQRIVAVRGRRLPPYDSSVRYWAHRMMEPMALFSPDPDIWSCQTIGVTEGEIKAIVAYRAWKNGVIPFPFVSVPGSSVWSDSWFPMLRGRHVVLAFDADANGAGQEAQYRLADRLVANGVRTSHIHLPIPSGQSKNDLDSHLLPLLESQVRQEALHG